MSSNNNAESIDFKTSLSNEVKKPCDFNVMNLDKIINWINDQNIEESIKEELIKKVKIYPNGSLLSFKDNFSKHLSKAKKNVRDKNFIYNKELGEENEKESNTHTSLFDGSGISQEISESADEDNFG